MIKTLAVLVGGVVLGALAALGWRRRSPGLASLAPQVDPALVPDPALGWLAAARRARGVWLTTGDRTDTPWRRTLPDPALTASEVAAVEERLERLRLQPGAGTDRLGAGTLLYGAASGTVAGLLLSAGASADECSRAAQDITAILDGLARRPLFQGPGDEAEGPVEPLESIGLRLAYQLERLLNAEVIVAVTLQGQVKVVGCSGRADRRLLDSLANPGSPLYQVATSAAAKLTTIADPLGGIVPDRRTHSAPGIILPIRHAGEAVGAVVLWTDEDGAPLGPIIAEVQEALRNAGPRIVRARRSEEAGNAASIDALTGLCNQRGLDDAMHRGGPHQGTLIHADFDKFRLLNDTLGPHAGDAALVHFARLIHDQIRGGDVAARIGGEKFAVWLPGASLIYGSKVADRLRIRLGTTSWDWQGRSWPLSASFGVAAVPDTTRSLGTLVTQADAALREAKEQGRNRVEAAPLLR